jgi:hypothetical protein
VSLIKTDPVETAAWLTAFVRALPADVRSVVFPALTASLPIGKATAVLPPTAPAATTDAGASSPATAVGCDVPAQLDRLAAFWPSFEPRLRRLHDGMIECGYEPVVPQQRGSSRQASYIRYIDPLDGGRAIGATNSGTFTFSRKELLAELADTPGVKIGRYPTVHFDTEDRVDLILKIAKKYKKK